MYYIGLDISINSPGVTIFDSNTGEYQFHCFAVQKYRDKLKFKIGYRLLNEIDDVTVHPRYREFKFLSKKTKKDYNLTEQVKLEDAINGSKELVNILANSCNDAKTYVGIEGYSYGSRGSSLIDIVTYSTLIRTEIYNEFDADNVYIFTPSEVKMYAGKKLDAKTGNASKYEMFEYFIDNILNDDFLEESDLFQYLNNNTDEFLLGKNNTKVRDPISDIIDSYFIQKKLQTIING